MALSVLIFIIVLGLLIFIHELGHFIVARSLGIKVVEFAFGFPPKLFSKTIHGTKFLLNLIPIGGYVKLLGEDEFINDKQAFSAQSVVKRLAVVIAGVVMNYLLAIIVFAIGFLIGMTPVFIEAESLGGKQEPIVVVSQVLPDSPAFKAGINPGDEVEGIKSADDLRAFTQANRNKGVVLNLRDHGGKLRQVEVKLADGETPLGVGLYETALVQLPVHQAVLAGGKEATAAASFTFRFFGRSLTRLFVAGEVPQEVGGPVAIFGLTQTATKRGIEAVLQVIGILSVNLAILNIVPFPALDGGRALFIAAEGIFGRKVIKQHHEAIIHTVGFIILLALIVAITYRDILRLQ